MKAAPSSSSPAKEARLGLVLTGGTIGSTTTDRMLVIDLTDSSTEREVQLVRRSWTGPQRLSVVTRTPLRRFSEDMATVDWITIAASVRELIETEELSRVLVMHGTDTMQYTAAALSFLLADLDATIVLTGSNLPLSDPSSDGSTNIRDALLASHALPAGVYISFAGTLGASSEVHLGSTVHKVRAGGRAYVSPNHGPVAQVSMGSVKFLRAWTSPSVERSATTISEDIHAFSLFPGIDLDMVAGGLIASGKKGVVVRLYPSITGPGVSSHGTLEAFVRHCIASDIVVVTTVERYAEGDLEYPSGHASRKAGAIFARDMLHETAYVKLAWAIAHSQTRAEAEALFSVPIAGEVTAALTPVTV